ncbi:hypothetical protein N0V95_009608 [Ascochyta clinopodiicola]|nr:hypothetical protein N0V95_009608 [Ascochyta clinopodiicola]
METKDKLFDTSLESVEYAMLLETEAQTLNWDWLCRTYVQWHAIAFLLSELCVRTKGEAVSRAWRALEATVKRGRLPLNGNSSYYTGQQGYLWKPLAKLLAKAKAARERETTLEQAYQAIRSGQHLNINFPWKKPNKLLPLPTDQPSSDSMDRFSRPFISKLGGMPVPSFPTRQIGSPKRCLESLDTSRPITRVVGEDVEQSQWVQSGMYADSSSLGHQFQHLSTFGLDHVIFDVTDEQDYAFLNITPLAQEQLHSTEATQSSHETYFQPTMNGASPMDGVYTATQLSIGNVKVYDLTTLETMSGKSNDSSMLGGSTIDWQCWDDMVYRYGHGGHAVNNTDITGTVPLHPIHFL